MKHNRFTALFVIVLLGLLLSGIGMVGAQDQPEAGDAPPVATVEAVATLVAVMENGQVVPVVFNAPSASTQASDSTDWELAGMVFFGILLLVDRLTNQGLQRLLAKMIDPDKAELLYGGGVRMGLQLSLNKAARTPDTADDVEWIRQAKDAGYIATLQPDGTYSLVRSNGTTSVTNVAGAGILHTVSG